MRITEQRYWHWKRLRETPGLVVMMSERVSDAVSFIEQHVTPGVPFAVFVAMLAYANQLDERWYEVMQ